ncbi:LytR/AlgR family response regulator transcription factor [Brevibacillus daliensis]|uniref:LytR/AlgR family response regulator transcription factor n=1 Tax=Brevibacillus daliensis TaxID=2892995 RepID=UPI001E64BE59|nr:LytTR family DNA-binding domain-containing protein [Brevibacillus daliensis]
MVIRIMVAEDERLAREELHYLLSQEEDIEILPSASTGQELLLLVEEHQPDVVFLDIHMPEMYGIQAARMLRARPKSPLLVFSTAHEDYAVEAFRIHAIDYLLKPYDHLRLRETLTRIRQRMNEMNQITSISLPQHESDDEDGKKNSPSLLPKVSKLLVEENQRMYVIDPQTILFAVREERAVQIHTVSKTYSSKMTLQQLEEKLHDYAFFRIHRSYLVNLHHVLEVIPWFNGTYNLVMKNQQRAQIPVSRASAKEFLRQFHS